MIVKISKKWPFISRKEDPSYILGQFTEYFSAISKGEYVTNGRAARIRTYEQIMLDKAKKVIENYEN